MTTHESGAVERRDRASEPAGETAASDAPDQTGGAGDPFGDPGVPEHLPRLTDVDPAAARRAERQVAACFTAAALLLVAFVVAYFVVPRDANILGMLGQNLVFGLTLGGALLLVGIGAIQWARQLMSDHEIVEERHRMRSSDTDREEAAEVALQGGRESQIGRRPMLRRSLIGALGLLGIPPIILLGDLGPLPGDKSAHTIWRRGVRIVNDVTRKPLMVDDIVLGQLVNAVPENLADFEGHEYQTAKSKAAVMLVRMQPGDIRTIPDKRDWSVDGIMCYSKICTHVGCPVNLYEQHAKQVLCPCHQSTFDLTDQGRVVFGPAARNLPQLPIMVDDEGYLVAQSDFTEPVGPSYWNRDRQISDGV